MSGLHPQFEQKILDSDEAGGIWLKDVPVGEGILVQTQNSLYRLEHHDGSWTIEGHKKYCPVPTKVTVSGSTFGGSALKIGFVGPGLYMEFHVEGFSRITTSAIQSVNLIPAKESE